MPTACVVIRDSPSESVSKKKAPTKVDRGKGIYLLSEAALLEAVQLKKNLKKSKLKTHKPHASGLGVPNVHKDLSESENPSWGNSEDNDSKNDNSDDVSNDDDDDDVYSDAGGDSEASDSEKIDFDEDENPNLNQNEDEEEEYEEELKDTEHEEEGKGDAEMTNAGHDDGTQQTTYEQVKDDEHVILTLVHDTHKTEVPLQSSSISSDFTNQFLNLDNALLVDNAVVSMMNFKVRHEEPSTQTPSLLTIHVTAIPETSTAAAPTIPPTIPPITPLPQQSTLTPTLVPTTQTTTTSISALLNFSSMFGFDQRVFVLEKELSQLKQKAFRSYTAEFEKKAKYERKRYIDLVGKSVKDIIKDEVKSQLPQILPKEVSEFPTPVIQSTIIESLENVVLAKSSSQPKSQEHRDLYDALVKSYKLDKDLFESYGKSYSLKRDREDKDKDEDPPAGSDQGLKRRKTSKDAEPSKGSKSKESKSSSSKGTKSQPKSSSKSAQAEESVFETADTEMPQNQGSDLGNTNDQPNVEAALKSGWFKKPERPPTPDPDWNAKKSIDFRPPQTWISKIAKAEKPPLTFDELMSTPIDFSAYVINNLKIDNLTQEHLVGPAFNLLKGTCRSRVELEYHFEEYRGRQVVPVNYFINNDLEYLKGGSSSRKYTTSTTKTKAAKYDDIQGIEDMVPSLWSPVKVAYDKYVVWGISHGGPKRQSFYGYASNRVSKHDVFSTKRIIAVTHVKVMKWYDYGYLEEIKVRREDQQLYKFMEGDFPRLNLRDIEDMLLLLVQKKLSNLERDVIFDLNVALRMFTRCVVILKRVEDLQLGVENYQKKLNITKPEIFRSGISKRTPYTAYNNPQGIIYVDKYKINMLIRSDELYK
ncbi:hypothetical protein Tco_0983369, partial [Tanacetum coccineum]